MSGLVGSEQALLGPMVDPFGRTIRYLRVSVTDRCDLRCFYCMAEDMTFLPKRDLLTLEELDRLCGAFIGLGVEKIRLTGGEPLVRRGLARRWTADGEPLTRQPARSGWQRAQDVFFMLFPRNLY